jgi:methylated-DNA-[protein]-cysteine S-methyltransferase
MSMYVSTIATPLGPFTTIASDEAVLASGWTADVDDLLGLIHPDLRPATLRDRAELGPITDAVRAYHDGDLGAPRDVPVHQRSGPFLEAAWSALREVPPGSPVTYAELAALAGRPAAVRAAASACARNAAALFVPCHRVVRTGGGAGGFRWGTDLKRSLLEREARPLAA